VKAALQSTEEQLADRTRQVDALLESHPESRAVSVVEDNDGASTARSRATDATAAQLAADAPCVPGCRVCRRACLFCYAVVLRVCSGSSLWCCRCRVGCSPRGINGYRR
jgi:hypothetical protein